jgi:DNA-binding transcriptional regulator YhcF (GntR family)
LKNRNYNKSNFIRKKPDYLRAKEKLELMLASGDWPVGSALPPIDLLTEQFALGRISIQNAIKILAEEGFLKTRRGSGCYILKLPKLPENNIPETNNLDELTLSWIPSYLTSHKREKQVKKIRIAILYPELTYSRGLWEKVFDTFMENHPDIYVEMVEVRDSLSSFNEQKPDILQIAFEQLPYMIDSGLCLNPSELGREILEPNDFYPSCVKAASYNDSIWGVPLIVSATCQYYNRRQQESLKEVINAKGFWQALEGFAALSNKKEMENYPSMWLQDNTLYVFPFFAGIEEGKESLIDRLKNPAYKEFLERLEPYYRMRNVFSYDNITDIKFDPNPRESNGLVLLGHTASFPQYSGLFGENLGVHEDFRETNGHSLVFGGLNVIAQDTLYPQECLEVLRWLGQAETQKIFTKKGKTVANRAAMKSFNPLKGPEEVKTIFDRTLERTTTSYKFVTPGSGLRILNSELNKWKNGEYTTKKLLAELDKKLDYYDSKNLGVKAC